MDQHDRGLGAATPRVPVCAVAMLGRLMTIRGLVTSGGVLLVLVSSGLIHIAD